MASRVAPASRFRSDPDPDDGVAGQTTRAYLLDLWMPPQAPVGCFHLEVQVKWAYWTVRPMELRVVAAPIPAMPTGAARRWLPVEQGTDAVALDALADYAAAAPVSR